MTASQLASFRDELFALARRLTGDVSSLTNEALRHTGGTVNGNLSNMPVHPADLGSDNYEQDVALSLLENQGQLLEEVAAALTRIDKETYGFCENCARPIGIERLHVLPFAQRCVRCAALQPSDMALGNL